MSTTQTHFPLLGFICRCCHYREPLRSLSSILFLFCHFLPSFSFVYFIPNDSYYLETIAFHLLTMARLLSEEHQENGIWVQLPAPSEITVSPALLWLIVSIAAIFFISGIFHLLLRFFKRKHSYHPSVSHSNRYSELHGPQSLGRQLQQLFRLQDSGLDQSVIDNLPVFNYKDIIIASQDPFDCAVCLCEFSPDDKLRLIPICSHAFHTHCIDTWLLSNSTCPLCRVNLGTDHRLCNNHNGRSMENVVNVPTSNIERILSVRLGKLESFNG